MTGQLASSEGGGNQDVTLEAQAAAAPDPETRAVRPHTHDAVGDAAHAAPPIQEGERGAAAASPSPHTERGTWYFTFGVGQTHAGRFFVVRNATFSEARARMVDQFGRQWAFQYDEADWVKDGVSQDAKYGLQEIS